ncbi:galactofuranosyltransferase [Bifidobacterium anseris]|uniref:Galactofuranosyltransferase n=1 Tax=Bifidobacterium anseris TaxID=2020963 RepID=A0A2N5IZZ5_9BIFI|nr:glycosyltransferase [Bifidobacterium anseris]PLS27538.1 galactofuranosyltransferase [Bifidobacterium anseris]
MSSIRFANVLLETKPRALSYPTMYYHTDQLLTPDPRTGDWTIAGAGTVDFTTYFNALSVLKLLKYTRATAFRLHIDVKSAKPVTLTQTRAERLSMQPQLVESVTANVPGDNKWHEVTLDITTDPTTVIAGFQIATQAKTTIRNGWYEVEFDGDPRDVELAIVTTTFRKEKFIERNIALVKTELLGSDYDIAKHLTMHVIDNGSTLDAAALSDEHVTVTPNENVGGAGGFARGMIESLEQSTPATHVLLMDDDVEVSPESILRTYNLLRIVNDEYAEAFVSGAMLNIEDTQDQKEDTGFISTYDGSCVPAKPPLQVTKFVDVVYNECYDEQLSVPADAHRYAAWWYCVIPTAVIERNGLPLPVFVRFDDVEYGIRCNPKFMTMNGICVWHAKFDIRYNAGVERYQTIRNQMIGQMTTGLVPDTKTMLHSLHHMVDLECRKFNYTDAELALQGFEDFLKGPKFIMQPVAQECFMRANREKEQLVSFDELREQARQLGIDDFDPDMLTRQVIDFDEPRTLKQRAFDFLTRNGQRFGADKFAAKKIDGDAAADHVEYTIIPSAGWLYPAGMIHNENIIIAIDWATRKGVIRVKDVKRYQEVQKRYKRDLAYYKKHADRLSREYLAAAPRMESVEFWKAYLQMD